MKSSKFILFILILPMTLLLDLILFALTRSCPGCGSFTQWIQSEGALSFPVVVSFTEWGREMIVKSKILNPKS